MTIQVGIIGYGNLGHGVEKAVNAAQDMNLAGIFSRRDPAAIQTVSGAPVYSMGDLESFKDKVDVMVLCGGSATDLPKQTPMIASMFNVVDSFDTHANIPAHFEAVDKKVDVMVLCGGSATDLPKQTPMIASMFNVVDSFDTHANIPAHFEAVDKAAKAAGTTAAISNGWDPGLFSLIRVLAQSVLPDGSTYTFWGKGVSQGHSDAIRRIEGVADAKQYTIPVKEAMDAVRAGEQPELTTRQKHTRECFVVLEEGADAEVADAKQYTIPVKEAMDAVRAGEQPELTTRQKHTRECFVVLEEGADADRVENEIKTMPNYFSDYDTTVHFVSQEELDASHSGLPHGGFVMRSGATGDMKHLIEFSLNLDSNPEFTASVLTAAARAVVKMNAENQTGAKTIFDIPVGLLSPLSADELRKTLL